MFVGVSAKDNKNVQEVPHTQSVVVYKCGCQHEETLQKEPIVPRVCRPQVELHDLDSGDRARQQGQGDEEKKVLRKLMEATLTVV